LRRSFPGKKKKKKKKMCLRFARILFFALFCAVARAGTDFYALVGARPGADAKALRQAFRKTSLRWHPDRFSGKPAAQLAEAERMTKAISVAYKVLSDPETREIYDLGGYEDTFLLDEDKDAAGEDGEDVGGDGRQRAAFKVGSVSDVHSENSVTFTSEAEFLSQVVTVAHAGRGFAWEFDGAATDLAEAPAPHRSVWIVQLYRHDSERCVRFSEAWERVASSHAAVEGRNAPAVRFGRVHVTASRGLVESYFDLRVPRGRLPRVLAIHPNGTATTHLGDLTRAAVSRFVDAQIPKVRSSDPFFFFFFFFFFFLAHKISDVFFFFFFFFLP
jgi:curved DNA-binding protein CbpA